MANDRAPDNMPTEVLEQMAEGAEQRLAMMMHRVDTVQAELRTLARLEERAERELIELRGQLWIRKDEEEKGLWS